MGFSGGGVGGVGGGGVGGGGVGGGSSDNTGNGSGNISSFSSSPPHLLLHHLTPSLPLRLATNPTASCVAKIKVAFCDNSDHIERLLSHISQTPKLKTIVAVESFADNLRERADGLGISLLAYADLVVRLLSHPSSRQFLDYVFNSLISNRFVC